MNNKPVYFRGLNGLRAMAAIAVVVSHTTLQLKEFNIDPFLMDIFQRGKPLSLQLAGYGVTIFFVLSGFLITYLLQAEKDIQPINIKKFYLRRILRIWPLYYLYLSLAVITILVLGLKLNTGTLLLYVFYAANVPFILNTTLPLLSHYWSLGVEEQFYLCWPWINKKVKSLFGFILIAIIVLVGTKVALHFFYPNTILETAIQVTSFHCMLIGALGALLYKNKNQLFLKLADNKITQSICWLIMLLVAFNKFHLASFIDNELIAVVAILLIIGQVNVKNRIVNLDINLLDFLGKISYGIYVIHPMAILLLSKLLRNVNLYTPLKCALIYTLVLTTTIFLAFISYTYFEKYFMALKKKYEVVKSSASKNIS
jgi:peptidoglycan/LPS O-acetylase OafA/YrhL